MIQYFTQKGKDLREVQKMMIKYRYFFPVPLIITTVHNWTRVIGWKRLVKTSILLYTVQQYSMCIWIDSINVVKDKRGVLSPEVLRVTILGHVFCDQHREPHTAIKPRGLPAAAACWLWF